MSEAATKERQQVAAGELESRMTTEVQLAVQEREVSLNLQIWKSYVDEVGNHAD